MKKVILCLLLCLTLVTGCSCYNKKKNDSKHNEEGHNSTFSLKNVENKLVVQYQFIEKKIKKIVIILYDENKNEIKKIDNDYNSPISPIIIETNIEIEDISYIKINVNNEKTKPIKLTPDLIINAARPIENVFFEKSDEGTKISITLTNNSNYNVYIKKYIIDLYDEQREVIDSITLDVNSDLNAHSTLDLSATTNLTVDSIGTKIIYYE